MPSKVPTLLYFVIILLIVLEISLLMPSRIDVSSGVRYEEEVVKEADLHIEDFELTETRSKDLFWSLHADRALVFRNLDLGVLSDIKGELIEKKHRVKLGGKQGFVFISEKSLLLLDDVSAQTEEGYRLLTSYLLYDGKNKVIRTAAPVSVAGPDPEKPAIVLNGQGILSSIENQRHEVLSRVKAKQSFLDEPMLFISSDRGMLEINEKIATFEDDVEISKGKLKINSDKFKVKFIGPRDVEWASATGNVSLTDGGWEGTCKEAILFGRDEFIQLRGGAMLTKGQDVVKGEMITLDRVRKKVIIDKVSAELKPARGL